MVSGLYTAASGMDAQLERLSVLANNLANLATVGFKADHLEFSQFLTSPTPAGPVPPAGLAGPPSGPPIPFRVLTDHSQGILRAAGNALDLAINGPGFFVLETPTGPQLTRAGNFTRNPDGVLVAQDGTPVQGVDGNVVLGDGVVTVDETGRVLVNGNRQGQLLIVDPPDLTRLTKTSATRFISPQDEPLVPVPAPNVRQGTLELSNVKPFLALVSMTDALRNYEAAQRVARATDSTLGKAVNEVGRV